MVNPIKYLKNLFQLLLVLITVNKYRVYPDTKWIKLVYKPLLKRPILNIIRIKINGKTCGLLVTSRKRKDSLITYIDYIWVNQKYYKYITSVTESVYYQTVFNIFMRWYDIFSSDKKDRTQKIAITININNERQVERFRRILTLEGFELDESLTLADIDFIKPWREKEQLKKAVYTRFV